MSEEPSELSDTQLRNLGRVAVAFGRLELSTAVFLWELLDPGWQQLGQMLTAGRTFGDVLRLLEKMASVRVTGFAREPFARWLEMASEVNEKRNAIFHSHWIATADDPAVMK